MHTAFNSLKEGTEVAKIKFETIGRLIGRTDRCWERAGVAVPVEKVQMPVEIKQR